MRRKIIVVLLIMVLLLTGCAKKQKDVVEKTEPNRILTKVFDDVLDAGTYTTLDFDYADKWYQENNDNWGGGCTAVGKVLDDGTTLVGRNMDLTYGYKSAYVFKTDIEGKYQTLNLAFTHRDYAPDYDDAVKNGITKEFDKMLPFYSDDVLNEKGLYMEINMRNAEFWPDGTDKFSSSGTNEKGERRVHIFELPMYVGLNCATVDEALKYIKTLDIYNKQGYWNYSFLLADATGKIGVLEIANNNIFFNENVKAQSNSYVTPELAAIQELKTGTGRYDYVTQNVDNVKSSEDMYNLINDVHYSQFYHYADSKFDVKSELVGEAPYWTYDYVMDKANEAEMIETLEYYNGMWTTMTIDEIRDLKSAWFSIFTEVVNCNDKTIKVKFFEDDSKVITLSFE